MPMSKVAKKYPQFFTYTSGVANVIGMTQVSWHDFNQQVHSHANVYSYAQCSNSGWWWCFDNRKGKSVYHCWSPLNELLLYEVKSGRNKHKVHEIIQGC